MRTVIAGSLVLLLLFPFAALADEAGKDCITVSGRGMVKARPDVAFITLHVKGTGVLPSNAAEDCKAKTEKVVAGLQELKVATSIEVHAFSLGNNQAQMFMPTQSGTASPEAVNKLVIAAPLDLAKLYSILDTAVQKGALIDSSKPFLPTKEQNAIVYGVKDAGEALLQANRLAMADARSQAEMIAKELGVKLGKVNRVSTKDASGMGGVTSFYGGSENFDYFPVKFFSTAPDEVVVGSNVSVSYELTR
jgi:uncharacterized protein YggE